MADSVKIGIVGLGTVGASVFKLLNSNSELIKNRVSRSVEVVAVSARDKNKDRGINTSKVKWYDDPLDMADDKDIDIIVELIGGHEGTAFELIEKSLKNGKKVVTANKALIAMRAKELLSLLKETNGTIAYEAAIAGAIPIVGGVKHGLAANNISAIYGILNGTCNYILSEMSDTGRDFDDVLKEAQDKGYAEADPSFDVDGIDTAHKTSILAGLAFGVVPDFTQGHRGDSVQIKGIRSINATDIKFADELGYVIKLLGTARKVEGGIEQSVEPCLVPKSSPVASVSGALNAVYVDGDFSGKILMTGAGAGGNETASAVVADVIDIARGSSSSALLGVSEVAEFKAADIKDRKSSYFIRLSVIDKPGVIADISAILRDCSVSLESILQRGHNPNKQVSIILTTHETSEGSVSKALELISELDSVSETPNIMRIESF